VVYCVARVFGMWIDVQILSIKVYVYKEVHRVVGEIKEVIHHNTRNTFHTGCRWYM